MFALLLSLVLPAQAGTDCDDTDGAVYVGAAEAWYDGVDDDCDGGDEDPLAGLYGCDSGSSTALGLPGLLALGVIVRRRRRTLPA